MISLAPESCKVYTPKSLARAMVMAVAMERPQKWLEPCCGPGVFIECLHENGVTRESIAAIDIDPLSSPADCFARVRRGKDFLDWSLSTSDSFDCIVGNPPFVQIRRLPASLKQVASQIVDFNGNLVGEKSNVWYPFLIQATNLLRDHGNLAFVLPAACEYADYASQGRSILTRLFDRVDVIRSRRPLFQEVSEGVIILIAKGKGGSGRFFRRHEVENLDQAVSKIEELSDLVARNCPKQISLKRATDCIRLGEIMDVRIGGVTGDADYFLMNESKRTELGIPKSAVKAVLSKSKHVRTCSVSNRGWQDLLKAGEKVWMFAPKSNQVIINSVRAYLSLEKENGGCDRTRYKIQNRKPWYQIDLPEPPDVFFSGMSTKGLWMCMNEHPKLSATNTLYVGFFKQSFHRQEKYAWAISMLTSKVQKQIERKKRVYADGLSKLEPGQIAEIELPIPAQFDSAVEVYKTAIDLFLAGKVRDAAIIADEFVSSSVGT